MEIELKDLLEGTQKGVSEAPAESDMLEVLKQTLKTQLKEEAKAGYTESCKLLKIILQNIVKSPEETKFRSIKLSNPKFNQHIVKYPSALLVLEMLGFEKVHDDDPLLIYAHKETELLNEVVKILEKVTEKVEVAKQNEVVVVRPAISRVQKVMNKEADVAGQLEEYRKLQKTRVPSQKNVVDRPGNYAQPSLQSGPQGYLPPVPTVTPTVSADLKVVVFRVFELTNFFRVNQSRHALVWNDALAVIAVEHSKDMADGKVELGHAGYNKRYKRFPFRNLKGGAENVAFNGGFSDPGRVCVDGWIDSGPHRKNLLGKFNFMGVGVCVNARGCFFFTQLFALA